MHLLTILHHSNKQPKLHEYALLVDLSVHVCVCVRVCVCARTHKCMPAWALTKAILLLLPFCKILIYIMWVSVEREKDVYNGFLCELRAHCKKHGKTVIPVAFLVGFED